jgi:hypothetical protein
LRACSHGRVCWQGARAQRTRDSRASDGAVGIACLAGRSSIITSIASPVKHRGRGSRYSSRSRRGESGGTSCAGRHGVRGTTYTTRATACRRGIWATGWLRASLKGNLHARKGSNITPSIVSDIHVKCSSLSSKVLRKATSGTAPCAGTVARLTAIPILVCPRSTGRISTSTNTVKAGNRSRSTAKYNG